MKAVKTHDENLEDESQEDNQEFSDTPRGRAALDRWAKLQDESQGC
jgi:hypothetical protein